jgi:hypothetical protein
MDVPSRREPLLEKSISPLFFLLDPWSSFGNLFLYRRKMRMMIMMVMMVASSVFGMLAVTVEEECHLKEVVLED